MIELFYLFPILKR